MSEPGYLAGVGAAFGCRWRLAALPGIDSGSIIFAEPSADAGWKGGMSDGSARSGEVCGVQRADLERNKSTAFLYGSITQAVILVDSARSSSA